MRRLAAMLSLAATVAACGEGPAAVQPTRPGAPPYVDHTELEGPGQVVVVGAIAQLRVFAVMSDGTRPDVTSEARFTVIDERIVTVAPGGFATAIRAGSTGIFASYRNVVTRVGISIRVIEPPDRPFRVTAVVRDDHGGPLGGARVRSVSDGEPHVGISDGNGFVDLGEAAGRATVTATRLGYADGQANVSGVVTPAVQVTIWLVPNPGAFIERRVEQYFDEFDHAAGEAVWRTRIATRAGGFFDAAVESDNCDYNGTLQIVTRSGDITFTGVPGPCYGRVRFVVPAEDIELTVRGYKATSFRLTYREPR